MEKSRIRDKHPESAAGCLEQNWAGRGKNAHAQPTVQYLDMTFKLLVAVLAGRLAAGQGEEGEHGGPPGQWPRGGQRGAT